MNKQKRMIYIYEENVEFYDNLDNKSQFINDALQDARIDTRIKEPNDTVTNEVGDKPQVDQNASIEEQIEQTRQRDLDILRKSREG
jgi:putative NIF3 family GTP cyclohydrolase 1 type 2